MTSFKALQWYEPGDDPGYEDALLCAPGIGGRYSIMERPGYFILWLAGDEFTFVENIPTLELAKQAAEEDRQTNIGKQVLT